MIGFVSAPDPFVVAEYPSQIGPSGLGNRVLGSKTLQSSIIVTPATTKTVLIGGQSNMATAPGTTLYTTLNSTAQNLNIYDGGIYSCSDPILGASNATGTGTSSICARLMDRLISQSKATRAIGVPFAMGGTPFASWVPGASDNLFSRISAAILRCRARGLEPDCIIWGQGETDAGLGTAAATITTQIQAIVTGIRAMNCVAPFYVGLYTTNAGASNATTRLGITNSVSVPLNIVLGYDCDVNCTSAGGFRLADGVHLSDTGLATSAIGWQGIIFP